MRSIAGRRRLSYLAQGVHLSLITTRYCRRSGCAFSNTRATPAALVAPGFCSPCRADHSACVEISAAL